MTSNDAHHRPHLSPYDSRLQHLAPDPTLSAEEYEVIVTDDGATSTAEGMIRDFFLLGRAPPAGNATTALRSPGQWLVFIDDDCLSDPNGSALEAIAIRRSSPEGRIRRASQTQPR